MKEIPYIPENIDLDSLKPEQRARLAKLLTSAITLQELIDRYDKSVKDDTVINDDYWDIPLVLMDKFGVVPVIEANKSIKKLAEAIDHLDAKIRNHRHDYSKTYTGKAEFRKEENTLTQYPHFSNLKNVTVMSFAGCDRSAGEP